jgi:hypothetical protein
MPAAEGVDEDLNTLTGVNALGAPPPHPPTDAHTFMSAIAATVRFWL